MMMVLVLVLYSSKVAYHLPMLYLRLQAYVVLKK